MKGKYRWPVVLSLFFVSACRPEPVAEQVTIPKAVQFVGNRQTDAVVVEIGSMTCPACYQFWMKGFPLLRELLAKGAVRYAYVPGDPAGFLSPPDMLVRCLAEDVGFVHARTMVYSSGGAAGIEEAVTWLASGSPNVQEAKLRRCLDRDFQSDRRKGEVEVARAINARETPALLIGYLEGEAFQGWKIGILEVPDSFRILLERVTTGR